MKKRGGIGYFLREILIVVIGVLIAVSIGNYKENLDNEAYLKTTLRAIENEVLLSQTEIDTVLDRHLKLFEKLEEEIGENDQTLGQFVSSSGGFQAASIKNVSLRFFISNKAELLDFELISELLDIESKTELLSDKIARIADFAYENVNEKDEKTMMKFGYLLADVIDLEQNLSKSYTSFLKKNDRYLKNEENNFD